MRNGRLLVSGVSILTWIIGLTDRKKPRSVYSKNKGDAYLFKKPIIGRGIESNPEDWCRKSVYIAHMNIAFLEIHVTIGNISRSWTVDVKSDSTKWISNSIQGFSTSIVPSKHVNTSSTAVLSSVGLLRE